MTEQTLNQTDLEMIRGFLAGLRFGEVPEVIAEETHRFVHAQGGPNHESVDVLEANRAGLSLALVNRKEYEALKAKVAKLEARNPATR